MLDRAGVAELFHSRSGRTILCPQRGDFL